MNTAAALLAASTEAQKSGPIGLVVIVVLCIGCYFLFRSMSRHMRKVREEFPATEKPTDEPAPKSEKPENPPS